MAPVYPYQLVQLPYSVHSHVEMTAGFKAASFSVCHIRDETTVQSDALKRLKDLAQSQVGSGQAQATLTDWHRARPDQYTTLTWASKQRLSDSWKALQRGQSLTVPMKTMPYEVGHETDPFYQVSLPKPNLNSFLVVFRAHLGLCSKARLNVLYLLPCSALNQQTPRAQYLSASEIGCRRYNAGKCSNCAAKTKLQVCSGCKLQTVPAQPVEQPQGTVPQSKKDPFGCKCCCCSSSLSFASLGCGDEAVSLVCASLLHLQPWDSQSTGGWFRDPACS